ncbi:hypothetical protein MsAg5_14010 [Methanosarcinaceae archaeon Ag5]|uniref:Uncharacterized protein n=1 Tax=Methanolapillus africanus TaxID=3028297 RepID=A0AAE4MKG0_9EURY|nr:hypothetical protein [Methanosarcinaceae archaeon Ag5]
MTQKNSKTILWIAAAVLAVLILSVSVYVVGNDYFSNPAVPGPSGNGSVQPPAGSSGEGFEPENNSGSDGTSGSGTGSGSDPIHVNPGGSGQIAAAISVSGSYSPEDWSQEKTVTIVSKTTKVPIKYTRWVVGEYDNDTFPTDPLDYSDYTIPFNVTDDGKLTFYVEDDNGRKNTSVLTIEKIDNTTPAIDSIELNPDDGTWGQSVDISLTVTDLQSGVAAVKYAQGVFTIDDFPDDGTETTVDLDAEGNGSFTVTENDNYTIYAVDNVGNAFVFVQEVANIDTTAPEFGTASLDPASSWNPTINVSILVTDSQSDVSEVRYAKGRFTADNFTSDSTSNAISLDSSDNANFTVSANGRYTVYAIDAAGNAAVYVVQVTNVDKKAPTFESVTLDPIEGIWNQTVDVSVTVSDEQSLVASVMYIKGKYTAADFPTGEATDITSSPEFTVSANGRYTVCATDNAGNKRVTVVQVTNVDKKAPKIDQISLSPDEDTWNQTVDVSFHVEDTQSDVAFVKYEKGRFDVTTFPNSTAADITGDNKFIASANGKYTIYTEDNVGNKAVKVVTVSNVDKKAPVISRIMIDMDSTPKVMFNVTDLQSGVNVVKYLPEKMNLEDFDSIGTVLTGSSATYSFDIGSENVYTVYVRDNIGNEKIQRIRVSAIDVVPPEITNVQISDENEWATEKTVTFNATDDDELYTVLSVKGEFDKNTFDFDNASEAVPTSSADEYSFDVTESGKYTIYAEDSTGNRVVYVVEVTLIDTTNPTIAFSNSTVAEYSETLTVTPSDSESGINTSASLWVKGSYTQDDFEDSGSEAESLPATLPVFYRNGVYSFYVVNNAGLVTVETYQVQSINLGTESSPLLIYSHLDISRISEDLEEGNNALYYQMQENITNFSEVANSWVPVGAADKMFAGVFDGNGKNITGLVSLTDSADSIVKCQSLFGPTEGGTFKDLTLIYSPLNNNYYGNAFTTTPQTASLDYCKVNSVWVFSPDKMANVIAEIEAEANKFDGNKNNKTTIAMHTLGYIRHIKYNDATWTLLLETPNTSFTSWMDNNASTLRSVSVFSGSEVVVTDTYTKDGVIDFIHLAAPLNAIVSTKAPEKTEYYSSISLTATAYTTYEQDDIAGWVGDLHQQYPIADSKTIGKRSQGNFSQEDMFADLDAVNIGDSVVFINTSNSSKNYVKMNVSEAYGNYYSSSSRSEQERFNLFITNMDNRSYANPTSTKTYYVLGFYPVSVQIRYNNVQYAGNIKKLDSAISDYTKNVRIYVHVKVLTIDMERDERKWQVCPASVNDVTLEKLRKEFGMYIYTNAGYADEDIPAMYK